MPEVALVRGYGVICFKHPAKSIVNEFFHYLAYIVCQRYWSVDIWQIWILPRFWYRDNSSIILDLREYAVFPNDIVELK